MSYRATTGGKILVVFLFIIGVGLFGYIIASYYRNAVRASSISTVIREGVFTVREGSAEGVGFFVTETGYAITAAFPLLNDNGDYKTSVRMPISGKEYVVDIVAINPVSDISILRFPPGSYRKLRLMPESNAMVNDEIVTYDPPVVVSGTISRQDENRLVMETSHPLQDRAIGAPIGHKKTNSVIGIVGQRREATDQKDSGTSRRFITSSEIVEFFRNETNIDLFQMR